MPTGYFDPDFENYGQKRPAWMTPKTDLARRALAACGRTYFSGQTKHFSEFSEWDSEECKVIKATDEAYLHRMWIENCIKWATDQNARGVKIKFMALVHLIKDTDKAIDWKAGNREKVLSARGGETISAFNTAAVLARRKALEKK